MGRIGVNNHIITIRIVLGVREIIYCSTHNTGGDLMHPQKARLPCLVSSLISLS